MIGVTININHNVKVKLTEVGKEEHKRQHEELVKEVPSYKYEYQPPKEDEDGYSEFQLHDLMNRFGHLLVMGRELPFDTDIKYIPK